MTETKTNPIFRLMPSLTDVAFLFPLVFLFAGLSGVRTMLSDGDTGWHIRTGEWIVAHGAVPRHDMFSFTKPGAPFFAWEWLWDVCFAWIHGRWGLSGVVLVSIFVLCLTSALLYKLVLGITARAGRENPLVAIALTGLAMAGASMHWMARPHLFTMLFVVVFLMVLERSRTSGQWSVVSGQEETSGHVRTDAVTGHRPLATGHLQPATGHRPLLWLLPLLTILWTNLHGGFIVGIALVAMYGVGSLLGALVASDGAERAACVRNALPDLATAAGCALASLVNPYAYHLHQHIYAYLHDRFPLQYIQEFQATNFQWGSAGFLEIMLALAGGAVIWYAIRRQFSEVLVLAGFAHLSLVIARNIPIFMIAAAPLVAGPLVHWLRALAEAPVAAWLRSVFATFEEIGMELQPLERAWRGHAVSAAALVLLAAAMNAPGAGLKLKPEFDAKAYPVAALAELQEPGQRIYTHDQWGDYLIYRLYPQGGKVYIDGRSDFYGDKFCLETLGVMNVRYDWEKTLARYGVDTILVQPDTPLAGAIKESRQWRVRYDDGLALVFRLAESAPGANSQVSAGTTGGFGGRDQPVAESARVNPKDHVFQQQREGVNP